MFLLTAGPGWCDVLALHYQYQIDLCMSGFDESPVLRSICTYMPSLCAQEYCVVACD